MEEDNIYIKNQERYAQGLRDQYNTVAQYDALEDYQRIIHQAQMPYAVRTGETLQDYIPRLEAQIQFNANRNHKTHVDAPKGCWYTHKSPLGCFMCDDRNMTFYTLNLIKTLAKHTPLFIPRPT